jgi:hypothetical protein
MFQKSFAREFDAGDLPSSSIVRLFRPGTVPTQVFPEN